MFELGERLSSLLNGSIAFGLGLEIRGDRLAYLRQRARLCRLVVCHTQNERAILTQRDERAVASLLEHLFAECCVDHVGIFAELTAAFAGETLDRLERQVQLLRHGLELRQAREREVCEFLRLIVENGLRAILAIVRFELRAYFLERPNLLLLNLFELDHVIAELSLDRSTNLALLHAEERILERPDEHAALSPPELSALRRRSWILRVCLRERGEISAILELRCQLLCLLLRGRIVDAVTRGDQNVASATTFG